MRLLCFSLTCLLLFSMVGCHHNNSDDPQPVKGWERVETFGTEPVLGLHINSDSTELHVMTNTTYGYRHIGQATDDFSLQTLANPLGVNSTGWLYDDLPYFTDDYCFYCNPVCDTMYIYRIGGGLWDKVGELSVYDFIPDSTGYRECFGRSHWLNLPNHIIYTGNDYYVTTESRRILTKEQVGACYQQHLIEIDLANSVNYTRIYDTEPISAITDNTSIFSSCFISGLFLQDYWSIDQNCHIILRTNSPEYIPGSGNYPIRDRFYLGTYMIGLGDGVIMRSYNNGIDWEEWLILDFPWSYACIDGKTILYYFNNIAQWNVEIDPTSSVMLDSEPLTGLRIHYLVEFGDQVYAATNEGLWVRPLHAFFTPREEDKSGVQATISGGWHVSH